MRVVHVSSEIAPFAQSGGLADVLAGLPTALADMHGLDVAVVVPLYRGVDTKLAAAGIALDSGAPITVSVGPHHMACALRRARLGGVMLGFVDLPSLYDRSGSLYGPGGPAEFPDNHVRFAALGKVAVEHGAALVGGPVDVLHVHDWQGAAAALYAQLRENRPAVALTIHHLAYRGIFPKAVMDELGLPWSMFDVHLVEFWDQVCFLKGAMAYADAVTTVSPSYAREILTPERGAALDAFLRWDVKRLSGIVNGIDTTAWDPATDPALPAQFSRTDLAGKQTCRRALSLPLRDVRRPRRGSHRLRHRAVTPELRGQRSVRDAVAVRAVRARPALCDALRRAAGRPRGRRAARYRARWRHRHSLRAADAWRIARCTRASRARVSR